ncbi:MAG TPA: HAMP domain-containing histidine kinase, partial [Deltaproteobacteria bacterium]|nr:HAMP domain-containing histidine kinase [Deltaproteobacteria bacterium]
KIFQPFYTTRSPGSGTGFGLAGCQSVVNRHSGKLKVESTVGVDTTFRMELSQMEKPDPA